MSTPRSQMSALQLQSELTWRGYKPTTIVALLISPLLTTHEPPSMLEMVTQRLPTWPQP